MKECILTSRYLAKRILSWFVIIAIHLFTFISCSDPNSGTLGKAGNNNRYVNKSFEKRSFVAPIVTRITHSNRPKIITAGQPIVKIDPSGVGIPFFTNYSTKDGLPVNNIICSAKDRAGNLWFGTGGGGLTRYDGKNFMSYTKVQGLAGNIVFYIFEDIGLNLWIGTTSGLSKYDGKKFTNYGTLQGLASNFVTCILQDNKRNLWFGTHDGGVSKYDGNHFTNYTTANGLSGNYVRCIMQDKKGNLWFGTDADGISKYTGSGFTNYTTAQGLANNSVNCIAEDIEGNLWFGTNAGASKYNFKVFKNYSTADGLADNNVYCILQDKMGSVWFGTHTKGVSKYNGTSFKSYTKSEGLAENKISSIIQDREGNIWISSQGGGVSKYEGSGFTNYTTTQGLAGNLVFYMTEDKLNNLWFGTYEGGVSKYNGKSFSNYTKAQGLQDVSIWCMITDKSGNVWFGSDRAGVSKYDGKRFTNYTIAQGLAANAVISMCQDRKGNIWFGTRANGVSKFDGNTFTNYTIAQGLAGNNVWSIVEDRAGNIWFGTHENGASKFDGNRFTNYTTADGLAGNAVSAIAEDKAGKLWFGTDGQGVSKFDGEKFINYGTAQGLADNTVSFIVEDKVRDIVWFGTNQGLSGRKEQQPDSNSGDNGFQNLNIITGYPIKDVSTGGMFADSKGIVWVGSGEGKLIRFDYAALNKKDPTPLSLAIQDVKVDNESICWNNLLGTQRHKNAPDSLTILNEMVTSFGKVLTPVELSTMREKYRYIKLDGVTKFYPVPVNLILPHRNNNITIDFAAIEPAMPKQVQYQYKLEGYNNNWSQLSNNSSAVFGNIKAGNYIFQLKALSAAGVWSEKEYTFKVLPPWWLTWWAYLFYGVAVLAIFYIFYRYAVARVERRQASQISTIITAQEEERERISRDLHDDIGPRLTNINILSALGQQKTNETQESYSYLKRISNEVLTSADALDDIVWSIDTKNDSMEEVTTRMRRYVAEVFDATTIRYAININERFMPAKLPSGKRRDLFMVFKETLNNIQKHAMATEVIVNIEAIENHLLMQIHDNGKGFDTNELTHRNGLKNIHHRIQRWGGTVMVHSSAGGGAEFEIKLPLASPSLKKGIWHRLKNR